MKIARDNERPGTWKLDGTIAGGRIREHGFKTQKAAEEFWIQLKDRARRNRHRLEHGPTGVTLKRLVEARIADVAKLASARRFEKKLLSFLAMFPDGFLIDDVKVSHLREWANEFKRAGVKAETVNSYLSIVSGMFKAAPALMSELDEEWRGPKIPWEKAKRQGRERVITAEELTALLGALRMPGLRKDNQRFRSLDVEARRQVADCLELAVLTGMRGIEVRRLEWSEVELNEAEIHLPAAKTKTGTARDVLLNRRAMEILRRRREGSKSRFVFPRPDGKAPRLEISPVVRKVARAIGLRYGRDLSDGFSPHDTRHTATTRMLRSGHDLKTVQDVLGHSNRMMTLKYAHSTRESRREAVESLTSQKE